MEKLKHSKKIYLEQNKTFQSLPPLTSQLTLHCCLRNIGVNNFPQNEKKINFIVICVLEKLGLIVQVWIINSKYGGTYIWTILFENGSTKNGISTFQANLDFGGVRGEEEYYSKLPVRSL